MLPVLLDLNVIKIYTIGVFLVLAFFWGSFILWRLVRLSSFKEDDVFDILFNMLFGGLIMGRLVYVLLHFNEFGFNILKFILINGYPGLSFFGMVLGSLGIFYFSTYLKKINFREIVDYYIPSFFLALGIGKLGGFFAGSEIGSVTTFPIAMRYLNMEGLRHLTPLYESIIFFIFSYISHKLLFEIRKEKLKKGFNLYLFLWTIGLVYFIFDNMKGYKLYFLNRSFNGFVSGILLLTFSFYFVYYFRSLIFKRIRLFINLIILHGKRNFKNIRHKQKKAHIGGEEKNTATN